MVANKSFNVKVTKIEMGDRYRTLALKSKEGYEINLDIANKVFDMLEDKLSDSKEIVITLSDKKERNYKNKYHIYMKGTLVKKETNDKKISYVYSIGGLLLIIDNLPKDYALPSKTYIGVKFL